jgi:hypothetical protein
MQFQVGRQWQRHGRLWGWRVDTVEHFYVITISLQAGCITTRAASGQLKVKVHETTNILCYFLTWWMPGSFVILAYVMGTTLIFVKFSFPC